MMGPPLHESPGLSQSSSSSETMSDSTIYLDDIASRMSRSSQSLPRRQTSYIQRYSSYGAEVNLTITEPRISNSYALHLGPRLSLPPSISELEALPLPNSVRRSMPQQVYQPSALSNVVAAVQYEEPRGNAIEHAHRLWSPWPLRVWTLLSLLVLLLGCIAALEVLSLLSKRGGGLGKWNEAARFIWTYVPPLIFFIIACLWEQVEYRTKQMMPWRSMASAPASASHSILLNYITPLNILAFVQSIELGHPSVAVSIAAGVIIKFLIIASSAILSLQNGSLTVQVIPLRMMEAFLGALVLLTSAMVVLRPCPATPNDISTISGLAALMANSPGYANALRGLALASSETLESEVYKHCYQTSVSYRDNQPFFRISLASEGEARSATLPEHSLSSSPPEKWWSPIHDLTRLAILALVFGVIVAIELLHQRSQKNNGLVDITDSSQLRYAWQMVPAAVALAIFMLVGLVDYATRLIQPYQSLKRGSVPAGKTIQVNYLSHLAPASVLKASKNQHFGVVCSATAALIAPLLTVVSAGLFFPTNGDTSAGKSAATGTRLIQDEISTRIIEGILGAIFFLLAVSSVVTDTRKVLPYNPCSIARMSSLIAESNLIDGIVSAGSEWSSDKEIQQDGVFDMFVFSLGLFEKRRNQRETEKVFGIDVGDAEVLD